MSNYEDDLVNRAYDGVARGLAENAKEEARRTPLRWTRTAPTEAGDLAILTGAGGSLE